MRLPRLGVKQGANSAENGIERIDAESEMMPLSNDANCAELNAFHKTIILERRQLLRRQFWRPFGRRSVANDNCDESETFSLFSRLL